MHGSRYRAARRGAPRARAARWWRPSSAYWPAIAASIAVCAGTAAHADILALRRQAGIADQAHRLGQRQAAAPGPRTIVQFSSEPPGVKIKLPTRSRRSTVSPISSRDSRMATCSSVSSSHRHRPVRPPVPPGKGSTPAASAGRRNCSMTTTWSVTGSYGSTAAALPRRQSSQVRTPDGAPSNRRL